MPLTPSSVFHVSNGLILDVALENKMQNENEGHSIREKDTRR